jgi:hypothetical protein
MRHCERSEAIHGCERGKMDCFVASASRNDGETALFHDLHFRSGSEESFGSNGVLRWHA